MNTAKQIRKLRASMAADLSFAKLVKTDAFRLHLQQQVDACLAYLLPDAARKRVHVVNGADFVACTDGDDIYINGTNGLTKKYRSDIAKYYAVLGILFHEVAHIVYNDFATHQTACRAIERGELLYQKALEDEFPGDANLGEFLDALKEKKYTSVFTRSLHEVANCIADAHDEEKIIWARGGPEAFIGKSIAHSTEALWSSTTPLEDMEKAVGGKGGLAELEVVFSLILQFARFGEINARSEKAVQSSRLSQTMWACAPDLDQARQTDDSKVKYQCYNRVLLKLWPILAKAIQEEEQKQKNGSGNGGMTPEQQRAVAEAIAGALSQAAQQAGATPAPQKQETRSNKNSAQQKQNDAAQNSGRPGMRDSKSRQEAIEKTKSDKNSGLESVKGAAAQDAAEKAAEKSIKENALIEINAVNQNSTHRNVPVTVKRNLEVNDGDIQAANEIMEKVRPYSKRLQQKMLEALRDLQQGDVQKHKYFGTVLNTDEAFRPDRRFWSNVKAPQDVPNMAVSVLIDQSGSMSGARINAAREAAILLYDFCDGLNIPVSVAGHCTGQGVIYSLFADYDKANGKDLYRIARIGSGGCNRDGLALTISGDRLSKRPEEMKLLIIICDGQPNHNGYGGEEAAKDIQSIVRKFKRMGIETIACAIGDDKDKIQKIYKDGFVDISNLSELPKKLTSIVKKRIIR